MNRENTHDEHQEERGEQHRVPERGCGGKQKQPSKARDHYLLLAERPPTATILSLVRDAAARLPGGEGTRTDVSQAEAREALVSADEQERESGPLMVVEQPAEKRRELVSDSLFMFCTCKLLTMKKL